MSAPLHRELPASLLDSALALSDVTRQWDGDIVRQITDYIGIPAKSPGFDADWLQHGYIDTVVRNAAAWVEAQKVPGLMLEIVRLEGHTPVLFLKFTATRANSTQTVLMYGHLDKQPEFNGWRSDLGLGPNSKTANCMAGVGQMMAMRYMPVLQPSSAEKPERSPSAHRRADRDV